MKKTITWLKRNYLWLLPTLLFFVLLISLLDRNFYIGGDNVLPLYPKNNILKTIFVWKEENRGLSFFQYTLLFWQIPFFILSLCGIPPDIGIKIYVLLIPVTGFISTYLLYLFLFSNTKYERKELGVVAGFIFTLSASALLILPTTIFLSALPLCSYFALKYIDTRKFRYAVIFSFAIGFAYFAHLPQAKYCIIFSINFLFILLLYKLLKQKSFLYLVASLVLLIAITGLLTAPIIIPFLFDSFRPGGIYNYFSANFTNYNGDADLHSAALPFTSRFFNSNLMNDTSSLGRFFGSNLFTYWSFILWIVAFIPLFIVKRKKEKAIVYLLFSGLLIFIFIAKGSNPPFGEIYRYLLFHSFIVKVFRTTSLAVIGGMLFFSMLVTISVFYLAKKWKPIIYVVLFFHVIVFNPIYLGTRLITVEKNGISQKGFTIPHEYYDMGKMLDAIEEDTKILSLPLDEGYSYKDWQGYIGISLMDLITHKAFVHGQIAGYTGFTDNLVLQRMTSQESCYYTAINNIGYILDEKDSRIPYSLANYTFLSKPHFKNIYFNLKKILPKCTLPHVYIANNTILFDGLNNNIPDVSRFVQNKNDIAINTTMNTNKLVSLNNTPSRIIEAYSLETAILEKKVTSDLFTTPDLKYWTYRFSLPSTGLYEMVTDRQELLEKQSYKGTKGINTINLPVNKSENLIDTTLLGNTNTFIQKIKNWEKDTIYLLTISYTVQTTSDLTVSLDEVRRVYNGRLAPDDLNNTLITKDIHLPGSGDYAYQTLVRSDINAQSATVSLLQHSGDISLNSFSLEKITPPKMFLVQNNMIKKALPIITTKKLNSTKYTVRVENARDPYTIVLSETFNTGWKAYVQECTVSCNWFQQWLLKPLPEDRHLVVNGFSNAWLVIPSDKTDKQTYTIIIEYWPQRLFYIGVILSLLTLLGWIIIRFVSYFRR
ncbi:hypothetical protein BH11PAT1_BH11PAT1_0120 [soil metagenome]